MAVQRDQFPGRGATTAAREFFAITPSDSLDLPDVPRAIWVGTGGNIAVRAVGSETAVILKGVTSGQTLVIAPGRVMATGTTATDLVGLI